MFKIILGLGNNHRRYCHTRHNLGAEFIELFCHRACLKLAYLDSIKCRFVQYKDTVFAINDSYMNDCGSCAANCLKHFGFTVSELLVVHDDLEVPTGTVRYKMGGSLKGHNGLKSISAILHSQEFGRLRIGISRPMEQEEIPDYVLKVPTQKELSLICQTLDQCITDISVILSGKFDKYTSVLDYEL